jgi:hypothetical protein
MASGWAFLIRVVGWTAMGSLNVFRELLCVLKSLP